MKQESLFEEKNDTRPLADRMRPETLDEYVGQKQLVDKGNILWKMDQLVIQDITDDLMDHESLETSYNILMT